MRLSGGKAAAKAQVRDVGAEWRVSALCPGCGAELVNNVQPGPWSVPDEDVALAGPDGHFTDEATFARFEQRRSAGKLAHRDVAELPFQLWCFRCDRGVDLTVHAD